jgi:hypothetical protein
VIGIGVGIGVGVGVGIGVGVGVGVEVEVEVEVEVGVESRLGCGFRARDYRRSLNRIALSCPGRLPAFPS